MKIYWSHQGDPSDWGKESGGDSMWFPSAEQFMKKFPRLAVRIFWLLIKIREIWRKIKKSLKSI